MKYKAIGFDYGGVIKGKPNSVFRSAVCDLLGVSVAEYQNAYFKHNKKINIDSVTWESFWADVLNELGQSPNRAPEIMELSKATFGQPINTEVLELIEAIRRNNLKTGLLSNNTRNAADSMRHNSIDEYFDVFHVSGETGHMKPSREAYELFAKDLDVPLSQLIFVDDSESSLSSAEMLGYTPILFDSLAGLRSKLVSMGVL